MGHTIHNMTIAFHKAQNTPSWAEGKSPALLQTIGKVQSRHSSHKFEHGRSPDTTSPYDPVVASIQETQNENSEAGHQVQATNNAVASVDNSRDQTFTNRDQDSELLIFPQVEHSSHQTDGNELQGETFHDEDGELYCLRAFWQIIDEESMPAEVPSHAIELPDCRCGFPGAMRTLNEDGQFVWVCDSRKCTFLQLKKNSLNFRLNREMREKNRVCNPILDEF